MAPLKLITASSKATEERQSFPGEDNIMFTFRFASAFVLLLLVGACGSPSTPKSAVASAQSSSPTSAAASTASPAVTPSPAPTGWVLYTEPAWGYSINMPGDWHLLSAGEPDPQQLKSFSNENVTNVATLTGLDANGILVNINVSPLNSGCPGGQPPVGWAESTVPAVAMNIDGYTSVISGNSDQGVWTVQAISSSGKYCYSFVGVTLNHQEQLKMTPLFELMLQSFSFGTPVAPPF